jgi:hypothetical protein
VKRIVFVPKTQSRIIKLRARNYFIKRSFRKDFRIIFFAEKIGFKRNYLKRWGKAAVRLAGAIGKMGRGTRPVWKEEVR